MKLATTFFVVAFFDMRKEKKSPARGGANNLRLFSDFFQSINKHFITGIGAQNSYFIVGSYPIKEGL